jgi:hypothetical protein
VLLGGEVAVYSLFGIPIFRKHTTGLTSLQISEWQAFDRIYPIGEDRADYRISYLSSLITNLFIQVYGKTGAKLTLPSEYEFKWGEAAEEESRQKNIESIKHFLMSFASSQNRRVEKEEARKKKLHKDKKP